MQSIDSNREKKLQKLLSKVSFLRLEPNPHCLSSIDSTQNYLQDVLYSETEGEFVVSEIQTKGKGRKARGWASPEGGLWFSITLCPEKQQIMDRLSLLVSECILETLSHDYSLSGCTLKHPNDVFCSGKKIAGVLVDASIKGKKAVAYVGIGINLNNDPSEIKEISEIATSFKNETGKDIAIDDFLVSLLKRIDQSFSSLLKNS